MTIARLLPYAIVFAAAALVAVLVGEATGLAAGAVAGAGGVVALGLAGRRRPAATAPEEPDPTDPASLADAVLDGVEEPILLVESGRVTLANRAALALLGRHVVGQDARLAIRHPAAAPALSGEADETIRLEGLGAIGQLWEMRVARIVTGARVVRLIDRSAGVAAERMRTDFVANASHELRTPLASILGYIETLQGEAGDAPPVRARFLQVVLDEASRMQRLVQDLMSLSRVEADRFRAPADRIDLGRLARDVAAELSASERGRDVTLAIDDPLPAVVGDRPQLSQLLHNVVGNAMAYGRPGTPVAVALAGEAAEVRLTVADRGEGIAAHHLPRLTERFYRADASRSRAAGGTGLGLAIVKHIVERHRGRLSIDSTAGVGTTVTVRLPAVTEPQMKLPHGDAEQEARMAQATMLLVEDDAALAELLVWHFEREGFAVAHTPDGEEALLLARERAPDIVLLDWMVESLSGLEVCRRLRRLPATANVPIIMLTARGEEEDRVRGLETGADDYVTKPFSPRELVARVNAVLRRVRPALAGEELAYADITMDTVRHRVVRAGEPVALGPTEFGLLKHFLEHPGRVFSREQLLDSVWPHDPDIESRTVDVHIRRLRKAINGDDLPDLVRTVRSAGYALDNQG